MRERARLVGSAILEQELHTPPAERSNSRAAIAKAGTALLTLIAAISTMVGVAASTLHVRLEALVGGSVVCILVLILTAWLRHRTHARQTSTVRAIDFQDPPSPPPGPSGPDEDEAASDDDGDANSDDEDSSKSKEDDDSKEDDEYVEAPKPNAPAKKKASAPVQVHDVNFNCWICDEKLVYKGKLMVHERHMLLKALAEHMNKKHGSARAAYDSKKCLHIGLYRCRWCSTLFPNNNQMHFSTCTKNTARMDRTEYSARQASSQQRGAVCRATKKSAAQGVLQAPDSSAADAARDERSAPKRPRANPPRSSAVDARGGRDLRTSHAHDALGHDGVASLQSADGPSDAGDAVVSDDDSHDESDDGQEPRRHDLASDHAAVVHPPEVDLTEAAGSVYGEEAAMSGGFDREAVGAMLRGDAASSEAFNFAWREHSQPNMNLSSLPIAHASTSVAGRLDIPDDPDAPPPPMAAHAIQCSTALVALEAPESVSAAARPLIDRPSSRTRLSSSGAGSSARAVVVAPTAHVVPQLTHRRRRGTRGPRDNVDGDRRDGTDDGNDGGRVDGTEPDDGGRGGDGSDGNGDGDGNSGGAGGNSARGDGGGGRGNGNNNSNGGGGDGGGGDDGGGGGDGGDEGDPPPPPPPDAFDDADAPRHVRKALKYIRRHIVKRDGGVETISTVILCTQGHSLDHLGPLDVVATKATVAEVVGALVVDNGAKLHDTARWLLLLTMSRWLFAPTESTTEKRHPKDVLMERVKRFEAGDFKSLWRAHAWETKLPSMSSHIRQERKSNSERRADTIAFMKKAAWTRKLSKGAARMADVPDVPPNSTAEAQLRKLLPADVWPKPNMQRIFNERGFHRPRRIMQTLTDWLNADEGNINALVKQWRPCFFSARLKRAPAGTGLRTEHFKPFLDDNAKSFAILFEAIARYAMPPSIRRLSATVLTRQILKKLENGRHCLEAGTRAIGGMDHLFKEAWRPKASWAAKTIGPVLLHFGQAAVGLASGGEAVPTIIQLNIDAPQRGQRVVTAALDFSNAYSTVNLDKAVDAVELFIEYVRGMSDDALSALGVKDRHEVIGAAKATIDDIVFMRTHDGEVLTATDGKLVRFAICLGFTQGGLFSMVAFCIAVCMHVLEPLKRQWPDTHAWCIADDAHVQSEIVSTDDIKELAAWVVEYCRLADAVLNLKSNARKFKLLQHVRWAGSPFDVAHFIDLFPAQQHDGVLKRPTIVRGALAVNGVGVGCDGAARTAIALEKVKEHASSKLKVLEAFVPDLGNQTSELYGRFALKPSTVFNHQARGSEPSITRLPMEYAAESQTKLFRAITKTSDTYIRDVHMDAASDPPSDRRCEEAMHLAVSRGGFGWSHPSLIAAGASAARVLDTLYIVRRIPSVSALVPSADQWAVSGIPMLSETIEFVEYLVDDSNGFKVGPNDNADEWKAVRARIVDANGKLIYDGLEHVHGRHFQHVANVAAQQDLFDNIVEDITAAPATRAHFRASAQMGAGALFSIDIIDKQVELDNDAWLYEAHRRLNHPRSVITKATRCRGCKIHDNGKEPTYCRYHAINLPDMIPCRVGGDHTLSLWEHENGTHWDGCVYGGNLGAGHTSVSNLVAEIARAFGATAKVAEINLGPHPNRPDGANQKADGMLINWTTDTKKTVWDTIVTTAVPFRNDKLRPIAEGSTSATQLVQKKKAQLKRAPAEKVGYNYMTAAVNSNGGMGEEFAEWFTSGFAALLAQQHTDDDKWRVRALKKRFLNRLSHCVALRNWNVFNSNAFPRAGGLAPPPPPVPFM